jgi:hypothetical protein
MKKYNEEYFSVIDKRTGRKIVDCGDEMDALTMVSFDSQNRTITRNKILMSPVIDIEMPKALPTSLIDTTGYKEHQDNWIVDKINELLQIKLPEGQGEPVVV